MSSTKLYTTFSPEDIRDMQPAMKIGLLATVNPQGLPHITLLSSLMASGPTQLAFGQFTEGTSKENLLSHPQAAFLVMSLDKQVWRGTAVYTHRVKDGKDYDYYNNVPMFRYNAYFGVHTVYYLDLVAQRGRQPLPMRRVVLAALQTRMARNLIHTPGKQTVLNTWTRAFLNKLDNLKFLAYVGADGYPRLIPAIQAQSLDAGHVLFAASVYTDELRAISPGASLAVFGMALSMEDVLLRGTYQGLRRLGGVRVGLVQIDWVYNSMPPVPGQIYPPVELQAVTDFS